MKNKFSHANLRLRPKVRRLWKGMGIIMTTQEILEAAAAAKPAMAGLTSKEKDAAILKMAESLVASTEEILSVNCLDVKDSLGSMSEVMLDRLTLTADRILAMADGMRSVVQLADPIGKILSKEVLLNGLIVEKT